jgi:hypothetical protein
MYPHRLIDGSMAPEAISLLRETLASEPDGSVVMIEVGYQTNLANLLDSAGDSISPLNGHDLVAKKVRLLSVMPVTLATWNPMASPRRRDRRSSISWRTSWTSQELVDTSRPAACGLKVLGTDAT